jgi:hypothetical protein
MLEKKALSLEEIEGQTAVSLPDRHQMALVVVVIKDNNTEVEVSPEVAANLCNISVAAAIALAKSGGSCKAVA